MTASSARRIAALRFARAATRPQRARSATTIAYGTFGKWRGSEMDAAAIRRAFDERDAAAPWAPRDPVECDALDLPALRATSHLVVVTSSRFGMPPDNALRFARALLAAADADAAAGAPPRARSLAHMQHAVFGNGDPRYFDTFMGWPRRLDALLAACGSRRFFARGEAGEPHAPTAADACACGAWAPAMWAAARAARAADPPVAWDALWADAPSPHHHDMPSWGLDDLDKYLAFLDRRRRP